METKIAIFGEKVHGETYTPRPGAYAILLNTEGNVCLINAPSGYTLPGGGKDPGESDKTTLRREILEEIGYSIEIIKHLGYGDSYTQAIEDGSYFVKEGSYFLCRVDELQNTISEEDHIVEWLNYEDAITKIAPKKNAHAWILENYLSTTLYRDFLGANINVHIDRELGSKHPKHNYEYPINYGYIPGTLAGDGAEIDVYILGETHPVKTYRGTVIAIIERSDDIENKLVVSDINYTESEIRQFTYFQEQYFESKIILYKE